MDSDLTIITVAYDSGNFIDTMVESINTFTSPVPNIIVCDNGKNSSSIKRWTEYKNVSIVKNKRAGKYDQNKTFMNTSMRHGIGLNLAFSHVETKRTAIIEPDCAVLKKDWDVLQDGYEMRACVKGVGVNDEHYYFPCFMIFKTDRMYRNGERIDFRPEFRKHKRGIIVSYNNGKIKRYSDVGWQIHTKIHHDKVDFLESVRWDKERAQEFNKGFSHKTNVFLDAEENVIGSHFWRGSELSRRGEHAAVHKNRWIATVKSIING